MEELICIKTYMNSQQAEMARGVLETNGIEAMISADDAGGWRPELAVAMGGVRLLVREEDAKSALELLGDA